MQWIYVSVLQMVREGEGQREKRHLMLCKKVLRSVWKKTWNYRVLFLQKIKTQQYSDWLRPKYYIAIVMDDFFKLCVNSYGQQNSISDLNWSGSSRVLICSLYIQVRSLKKESNQEMEHIVARQVTEMITCLQKMKKVQKNWSALHLAIRVTVINLSTTIQVNSVLK